MDVIGDRDSPEARLNRHVQTMMRLRTRQDRCDYVQAVERKEGAASARAVKEGFLRAWDSTKVGTS